MNLPKLDNFDFKGKKVLVRCDLDVPLKNGVVADDARLRECLPTINYLLGQGVEKVVLMGHLGRPLRQVYTGRGQDAQSKLGGKVVEEFSLKPVADKLRDLLGLEKLGEFGDSGGFEIAKNIFLLENLRFDPREESNDEGFAKELAGLGDFYVNEAFAVSHREHASIVGVPKFLPHCAGIHFASEVENLSKVLENPKKPVVFVIGGAKPETKLPYIADFARVADWVLVGGLLVRDRERDRDRDRVRDNIIYADLIGNGLDISQESIRQFEEIIKSAGTVVWNGPLGKYEDEKWEAGTKRIGESIANSTAFKVAGGGDTIAALKKFGLLDKIDYVSTGGGAMLEFLAKGILPGIEALRQRQR